MRASRLPLIAPSCPCLIPDGWWLGVPLSWRAPQARRLLGRLLTTCLAGTRRWCAPCHAWLGRQHGAERLLVAVPPEALRVYSVHLTTGDLPGAGCASAQPYLQAWGGASASSRLWLGLGGAAAVRGRSWEVRLAWPALGALQRVLVGLDPGLDPMYAALSSAPRWYLDHLAITDTSSGEVRSSGAAGAGELVLEGRARAGADL